MKFTLLTCGLLMASGAFADPGERHEVNDLQSIDVDGDHFISLAEAQASAPGLAERFNEIDANHDGLLSIEELGDTQPIGKVRFTRDLNKDFAAADANGDGMLTRAEAEGKMPIVSDFFAEMDGNADGYVTQEEMREHARKHGDMLFIRLRAPAPGQQ